MKRLFLFILVLLNSELFAKPIVKISCSDKVSNCKTILFTASNDQKYDYCVLVDCQNNTFTYDLIDKSASTLGSSMSACHRYGEFRSEEFNILIFDSIQNKNTLELYFDKSLKKALLKKYESEGYMKTYDIEIDEYFSFSMSHESINIRKKNEIELESILLTNVSGTILSKNENPSPGEIVLSLEGYPTGMYFLELKTKHKIFIKKVPIINSNIR